MSVSINYVGGERFAHLRVVRQAPSGTSRKWLCKCDCGNECIVFGNNLRRGNTTSCGCAHVDMMRGRIIHGHARKDEKSAAYRIWEGMLDRCRNKNSPAYVWYGRAEFRFVTGG